MVISGNNNEAFQTLMHDFNNCLHQLYMAIDALDLAIKKGYQETITKMMSILIRVKKRTQEIIENALKDHKTNTNLYSLLLTSKENYQNRNTTNKINIELHTYKDSINVSKVINTGRFLLFVENIIKNASEAPKVTQLDIYLSEKGVAFIDNGDGFPQSVLDNFNQQKDITSTKTNGHGIGLNSLRNFCKENNWNITLKNIHSSDNLKQAVIQINF